MNYTLQERVIDLAKRSGTDKEFLRHLRAIVLENDTEIEALEPSQSLLNVYDSYYNSLKTEPPFEKVLKTGYQNIDTQRPIYLSELVVIGARPAMGKTQFLVNLACKLAQNYKVLFFSLEVGVDYLNERFASVINDIPFAKLIQKNFTKEELEKIEANKSNQLMNNIFLNDVMQSKIGPMILEAERMIKEQGVKVVMVDYLQLLHSTRYGSNREMEIAYVAKCLKELAKKYNVTVFVTSQLSRAVETRGGNKSPMMSDLRESGAIEQDADKVLFLYRPEYYGFEYDEDGESTRAKMDVIFAKNRNGYVGKTPFVVDDYFIHIEEYQDPYEQKYINIDQTRLEDLF